MEGGLIPRVVRSCGAPTRGCPSATPPGSDGGAHLPGAKTPGDKSLIERQITATDNVIARLVYELYELSDGEIALVVGEKPGRKRARAPAVLPPRPQGEGGRGGEAAVPAILYNLYKPTALYKPAVSQRPYIPQNSL